MSDKDQFSLLSILEAIEKIELYTKDIADAEDFLLHPLEFDGSMMNFIIIGEMIARLSQTFKDNSQEIEWNKIKSFRNIIAHDYFGIDAEEVWQIIHNHIIPFKQQVKSLLQEF